MWQIEIDNETYKAESDKRVGLVGVVGDIRGSTFVGVDTETEPDMYKKGNPFIGRVVKRSSMVVQLNASDEKKMTSVDPNYTPKETYHTAIVRGDGTVSPLSVHKEKGTLYLRCHPLCVQDVQYIDVQTGLEVPKHVLSPWLKTKPEPTTSRAITREIANAPYRLFKIESIKAIRLFHKEVRF